MGPRDEVDAILADATPNLVHAALLLEKEEHPHVDVRPALSDVARWAQIVDDRLGGARAPLALAEAIGELLFEELGFRGNKDAYYQPENSHLTHVLQRRLGIPISLSMLYLGLGHHLRAAVHGIGFPGHFLVRIGSENNGVLCDPFSAGRVLDRDAALKLLRQHFPQAQLEPSHLQPLTPRATLARVQRNLKRIYLHENDFAAALSASDRIVYLQPHDADERRDRGMLFERLECFDAARRDYESYLEMRDNGDDLATIRERMLDAARRASLVN